MHHINYGIQTIIGSIYFHQHKIVDFNEARDLYETLVKNPVFVKVTWEISK